MVNLRFLFCALLQLAICAVSNAQLRSLPASFKTWTSSQGLEHATVSLEVLQLPRSKSSADQKPKVLYAYDAQRYMSPASILKLVTAATACRTLDLDSVWPDSLPLIDTTQVQPIVGLENYNPDWLIEDVATSYMPGLYDLQPDSGQVLRDVLREALAESLNLEVETLFRMLTPSYRTDSALLYVSDYWQQQGLDTGGLWMFDGCGLSPNNRVTAHFICSMLAQMQYDNDFRELIPIVGRQGTLRYFMRGTRLAGVSRLKSGTLKNVVSYAGYCQGSDQRTYAVCILVNNHTAKHAIVRDGIANLLLSLIP